jgi:hypothetical protein
MLDLAVKFLLRQEFCYFCDKLRQEHISQNHRIVTFSLLYVMDSGFDFVFAVTCNDLDMHCHLHSALLFLCLSLTFVRLRLTLSNCLVLV